MCMSERGEAERERERDYWSIDISDRVEWETQLQLEDNDKRNMPQNHYSQ